MADKVTRSILTVNDESTGPITSNISNQPPIPQGVQVGSASDAVGQRSIQEPPDAAGALVEEAVVSSQLSIAGIPFHSLCRGIICSPPVWILMLVCLIN